MSKKRILFFLFIISLFLSVPRVSPAQDERLFVNSAPPDALLVLDKSSSMTRNLPGGMDIYGNETCTGDLYDSPTGGYTTDCSRFEIGKRAIKAMLDDNGDKQITKDDESLNVRFGYMTFHSSDRNQDWKEGTVLVVKEIGTPYEKLWESFNGEGTISGTPLADALNEARLYMIQHREKDTQGKACRKKFVILISDGEDSVFRCNSGHNYAFKRRASVSMAKKLWEADIQLFVIGLYGENLPRLGNTLNWMAYYGNTDNPDPNSGDVGAFVPPEDPCVYSDGDPDPGEIPLHGYAFLATDAAKLNYALKKIKDYILQAKYSFTTPSVAASRTEGENFLYQASFTPVSDPFWPGSLKKYNINPDGSLGSEAWDAGEKLKAKNADDRKIYTRTDGAVKPFNTSLSKTFFDASTDAERDAIVGYIRGESAHNPEDWKLGDTFHSELRGIGSPSAYFNDLRSPSAFQTFRDSKKDRERIVVAGANDGQLHVFSASDGEEKYSFIPPNLLPKLKYITHSTHPADDEQKHQYFVDGPLTAADVWLGSGDGRNKSAQDWKTLLILAEGRGVRDKYENPVFLWSSSITCDQGFNEKYSILSPFYCGYHALDMTDTGAASPTYLWRIRTSGVLAAAYLSEPWSRMAVGRVKMNGNEKWVGFIGGGYPDGKGFFVIDLSSGDILWSYNKSQDAAMDYGIPASPAVVDVDRDGFIDTAYVGDLGGNMWRFKFCMDADASTCNDSNWSGGFLYKASSGAIRPVYTTAAVAKGSLWVFWGTGDKVDPTSPTSEERFFAISDDDRAATYTISDFTSLGQTGSFSGKKPGWYLPLGNGEKMIADPTVFGGIVLFTTYTPTSGDDLCAQGGTGKLYAMAMMPLTINGITYNPGAGVLSEPGDKTSKDGGAKSIDLGTGIPGAPVISQKPFSKTGGSGPTDIYVPISGAAGKSTEVITSSQLGDNPLTERLSQTSPRSHITHWRDIRLSP